MTLDSRLRHIVQVYKTVPVSPTSMSSAHTLHINFSAVKIVKVCEHHYNRILGQEELERIRNNPMTMYHYGQPIFKVPPQNYTPEE